MGGTIPLLLTFAGAFSKILFPMIRNGFQEVKNNLAVLRGTAQKEIESTQNAMRNEMLSKMTDPTMSSSMKE
jgi:DNA-binding transcriptional MocR family regulator